MQSIESIVTNLIFRLMPSDKPGEKHDYVKERKRNDRKPPKLPKDVNLKLININGFDADYITKKENQNGLIFYIHGGGFTTGSAKERRMISQYIVNKYGYNCISINYRLAPENKWPSMIEDCFDAYNNVLKMEYDSKDIVFMGESAGGTLVLSLALLLKDGNVPLPKAIVSFSPCTDQYSDLLSHTKNIKTDYMLKDAVAKGLTDVLFEEKIDRESLKDYLLSPYYGDYKDLPPIYLSASDTETLYDDSLILYNKLKNENHNVVFEVAHNACHAYQIMTYMPEAKKTLNNVFNFLKKI